MPAATNTSTTVIDVADAVAAEINTPVMGTVWLQSAFDCEQRMLPAYDDADLAARIKIAAIPMSETCKRFSRSLTERDHLVELWFQKKVDPAARETGAAELARFAAQVKDYFLARGRVLSTLANVYPMKSELHVNCNPKDLAQRSLWVGVVHLTFTERTNQ